MGRLGGVGRERGAETTETREREAAIGEKYIQQNKEECGERRRERKRGIEKEEKREVERREWYKEERGRRKRGVEGRKA